MLKRWSRDSTHEDVFLEHYGWLRNWARQLTGHDTGLADDLLHDAFVRFAVSRPPLAAIDNTQAYLYTLLRNLHLSHLRRGTTPVVTELTAADAESVRDVISRVQPDERLKARQDLELICDWACTRKDAFKGAGFLILRFFHGYVPGEIARIGRTSAKSVDDFLRLARQEMRAAVKAPARRPWSIVAIDEDPDAFVRELLDRIFKSRRDRCLGERELIDDYADRRSIATPRLAHVASCAQCLDRINRLLGLASRDDRTPGDGQRGPRAPGSKPTATSGGGDGAPLAGPPRRGPWTSRRGNTFRTWGSDLAPAAESAQAIRDHRPTELLLVANGWTVAWHPVNSAITEQEVSLPVDEQIGFVEVLNGAGLGLLYLPIDPPPAGDAEQGAVVHLANDRVVEARVRFGGPRPTFWVRYADPHFEAPVADATSDTPGEAVRHRRRWSIFGPRPRLALTFASIVIALAAVWMSDRVWAAAGAIARAIVLSMRGVEAPSPVTLPSRTLPLAYTPLREAAARMPAPTATPAPLLPADLADVEVRVLQALDRVNAFMGEQITIVRHRQGVRVEGIVDSVARRQAILAALQAAASGGHVDVHLLSVGEALEARPREAANSVIVRDYTIDRGTMPAADAIRRSIAATDPTSAASDIERRVQQKAGAMVGRSRTLLLHALALDTIAERYDAESLGQLNPTALATWTALLRRHGWSIRDEAMALRAELRPIAQPTTEREGSSVVTDEQALSVAVRDVVRVATQLDEGVRAAFTASPAGRPAQDLPSLVRLAARLEQLGERIARLEP